MPKFSEEHSDISTKERVQEINYGTSEETSSIAPFLSLLNWQEMTVLFAAAMSMGFVSYKVVFRQLVREAVNDRGLFTAGWFGVREKHCSWLEIYDRLRANEQAGSADENEIT